MTVSSHAFEIDRFQRGRTVVSVTLCDPDGGRSFGPDDFFFKYRLGARSKMDDEDDFVAKPAKAATAALAASKSDQKFKAPQPLSPRKNVACASHDRVSESEDSTAVAGRLTETDESVRASQDATSTDDVAGGGEDDNCFIVSPGSSATWECVRRFNMGRETEGAVFDMVSTIFNQEMMVAGTPCVVIKRADIEGDPFDKCTRICGFGRSHVSIIVLFIA